MNIIETGGAVVGVFAEMTDAMAVIAAKPVAVREFIHTCLDLCYPVYLLEITIGEFLAYASKSDAIQHGGVTLYTISADFRSPDWTDRMGELPHEHLTGWDT